MKKVGKTIAAGALACMLAFPAAAQTLNTGGLMADKDVLMPANLFELSQTQFNFGTARSMAMAGAFTSLGADMSSMAINPAGLGMYLRSEVSITPLMTFDRAENSAAPYERNSRNRFSVGNFGAVFNVYEGTGRLMSFNIGFAYNRLADLNYRSSFYQTGNIGSIADMYSQMLNYSRPRLTANQLMGNNLDWFDVNPGLWPAVLGYKGGLTDDPDNTGDWSPTWISGNRYDPATGEQFIDIGHYSSLESRGSIGEFDISVGANIGNKFYIGATIGIQSVYQKVNYYYAEDYTYPTPNPNPDITEGLAPDLPFQLLWSKVNQSTIIDGTGVNFKLGFTYRPIPNLRIGAAIHTPTYYSIDYRYQGNALGLAYSNDKDYHPGPDEYPKPDKDGYIVADGQTPVLDNDNWSFVSPTRILLGVSYMFGDRGLISVDYERAWYNGIRMKDAPAYAPVTEMYNDTFRNNFKGSNTIRIGAEFKPLPMLSLRAGFGYSGSWLKDKDMVLSSPIAKQITYYGAGVGVALSRSVTFDVAYSYQRNKQTDYLLYYADQVDPNGEVLGSDSSDMYRTDYVRHAVALTLGFRF